MGPLCCVDWHLGFQNVTHVVFNGKSTIIYNYDILFERYVLSTLNKSLHLGDIWALPISSVDKGYTYTDSLEKKIKKY